MVFFSQAQHSARPPTAEGLLWAFLRQQPSCIMKDPLNESASFSAVRPRPPIDIGVSIFFFSLFFFRLSPRILSSHKKKKNLCHHSACVSQRFFTLFSHHFVHALKASLLEGGTRKHSKPGSPTASECSVREAFRRNFGFFVLQKKKLHSNHLPPLFKSAFYAPVPPRIASCASPGWLIILL